MYFKYVFQLLVFQLLHNTVFEADICIRSKVIRGSQDFEIWSRDPGHADLEVVLWSGRSRGPSSMSVPNLKQIIIIIIINNVLI